jgi:hypothetical protein
MISFSVGCIHSMIVMKGSFIHIKSPDAFLKKIFRVTFVILRIGQLTQSVHRSTV